MRVFVSHGVKATRRPRRLRHPSARRTTHHARSQQVAAAAAASSSPVAPCTRPSTPSPRPGRRGARTHAHMFTHARARQNSRAYYCDNTTGRRRHTRPSRKLFPSAGSFPLSLGNWNRSYQTIYSVETTFLRFSEHNRYFVPLLIRFRRGDGVARQKPPRKSHHTISSSRCDGIEADRGPHRNRRRGRSGLSQTFCICHRRRRTEIYHHC